MTAAYADGALSGLFAALLVEVLGPLSAGLVGAALPGQHLALVVASDGRPALRHQKGEDRQDDEPQVFPLQEDSLQEITHLPH